MSEIYGTDYSITPTRFITGLTYGLASLFIGLADGQQERSKKVADHLSFFVHDGFLFFPGQRYIHFLEKTDLGLYLLAILIFDGVQRRVELIFQRIVR